MTSRYSFSSSLKFLWIFAFKVCSFNGLLLYVMNSFPFLSQKMNVGMEEHENKNNGDISQKPKKQKGKHDKPKPWDDDPNIDRWTIEKFDPSWNESGMLEVSSFSTLFPQYRGKVSIFLFFSFWTVCSWFWVFIFLTCFLQKSTCKRFGHLLNLLWKNMAFHVNLTW